MPQDPIPPLDHVEAALLHLRHVLSRQADTLREADEILAGLLGSGTVHKDQGRALPGSSGEPLTRQEFRVLEQIYRARTNRQIARSLGITEKTAKNYVQSVFRKLHVHSRTEAALAAARYGWFDAGAQPGRGRLRLAGT